MKPAMKAKSQSRIATPTAIAITGYLIGLYEA